MSRLHIHDTRTGSKRLFQSQVEGQVGIYVCGITVYSDCHIGHARCMLAFDCLCRYLRHLGYRTNYVRNITDVDDKIIARAQEQGIDSVELAQRHTASMHADFEALGLLKPKHEPAATAHIGEMVELVSRLVDAGKAYVGSNGDVFFSVKRDSDYGTLSKRNLDEMLVGARVESNPAKADPLDFALWKLVGEGELGWDSPWGRGRPGWHLECSAMSMAYLGHSFDIHGGGMDLCFPHHENEWAQSRCAYGAPFAQYWMHSGFVQFAEEKMSKSLGNTISIKQALQRADGESLRWLFLLSHYRSEVSYSEAALAEADRALRRFYVQFDEEEEVAPLRPPDGDPWLREFEEAMNDDLNTPRAMATLHSLDSHINKARRRDAAEARRLAGLLRHLGGALGLFGQSAALFLRGSDSSDNRRIDEVVQQRWRHRCQQRWPEADALRDRLLNEGVAVEDHPDKSVWYRLGAAKAQRN